MKPNFYKISVIVLMLAGNFYSCTKRNEFDNGLLKVGAITEIKLGETAVNTEYGLSIRVDSIFDSRCPTGSQCYWAGIASVQFNLTTKEGEYDFSFYGIRGCHSIYYSDMVIEGIKYQLIDVLPYPVDGEQQPEKTVKILVSAHSILKDTQWKLTRYQNNETSEITIYPQNIEPYIIHFKNDFTVEFPFHCNALQGTYIAGNDGSIAFNICYYEEYMYCGIPDWETRMNNNLIMAEKYAIKNNQLIIDCFEDRLILDRITNL